MLQELKIAQIVNNTAKIFGFKCKYPLHLQQIAFQFISLCFSCSLWLLLLQRLSQLRDLMLYNILKISVKQQIIKILTRPQFFRLTIFQ